jgi:hypothetical protein
MDPNNARKAVEDKIESQVKTVQARLDTSKRAESTKANAELEAIADLVTQKEAIDRQLNKHCEFHSRYAMGLPAAGSSSHRQAGGTPARPGDKHSAEDFVETRTNQRKIRPDLSAQYDFIVCGSGSSGSVVARRPCQRP